MPSNDQMGEPGPERHSMKVVCRDRKRYLNSSVRWLREYLYFLRPGDPCLYTIEEYEQAGNRHTGTL